MTSFKMIPIRIARQTRAKFHRLHLGGKTGPTVGRKEAFVSDLGGRERYNQIHAGFMSYVVFVIFATDKAAFSAASAKIP